MSNENKYKQTVVCDHFISFNKKSFPHYLKLIIYQIFFIVFTSYFTLTNRHKEN